MQGMLVKYIITLLLLLVIQCSSKGQENVNLKVDYTSDSTFYPTKVLVFEKQFNDSLKILHKGSILYNTKIKTDFLTERVNDNYYVRNTEKGDSINIKVNNNDSISIPILNPKYVHIGRNKKNAWFVLYTNELIIYK